MYRAMVRCSSSRRLVACMALCLLLTLTLWWRCDDSISRITASASSASSLRHASVITGSRSVSSSFHRVLVVSQYISRSLVFLAEILKTNTKDIQKQLPQRHITMKTRK